MAAISLAFNQHPDTRAKRLIGDKLRIAAEGIAPSGPSHSNFMRAMQASLNSDTDFYDLLELLALILMDAAEKDKDAESLPVPVLILHSLLHYATAIHSTAPVAPSRETLVWSLHPYMLASLSGSYFQLFQRYATTLVAWTRREVLGMISLCQSGTSQRFSPCYYKWASGGCNDVAGFEWKPLKSSTAASHSAGQDAETALLKRLDDLMWRWRMLLIFGGDEVQTVVNGILNAEASWAEDELVKAGKYHRLSGELLSLYSGKQHSADGLVGDCDSDGEESTASSVVVDDGGLSSLRVYWAEWFQQIPAFDG